MERCGTHRIFMRSQGISAPWQWSGMCNLIWTLEFMGTYIQQWDLKMLWHVLCFWLDTLLRMGSKKYFNPNWYECYL